MLKVNGQATGSIISLTVQTYYCAKSFCENSNLFGYLLMHCFLVISVSSIDFDPYCVSRRKVGISSEKSCLDSYRLVTLASFFILLTPPGSFTRGNAGVHTWLVCRFLLNITAADSRVVSVVGTRAARRRCVGDGWHWVQMSVLDVAKIAQSMPAFIRFKNKSGTRWLASVRGPESQTQTQ